MIGICVLVQHLDRSTAVAHPALYVLLAQRGLHVHENGCAHGDDGDAHQLRLTLSIMIFEQPIALIRYMLTSRCASR